MTDRSKAPAISRVQQIEVPEPLCITLKNDIKVYELNLGTQEVVKLDFLFKAGRWYEAKPLIARCCSQLLKAGTKDYDSEGLANFFEYYGAQLDVVDGLNLVCVQLSCLTKHLPTLLPVLTALFTEATLPESELIKAIKRHQQNLKLQLQKSDLVAYRLFTEELFGSKHPYGYNSTAAMYEGVRIEDVRQHYEQFYSAENCTVIVAGKFDESLRELLDTHLGKLPKTGIIKTFSQPDFPPVKRNKIYRRVSGQDLQASIRIGRRTFNRAHEDCSDFYFMNMVFGGYFGARLMQNLRERNGFTYGAYSSIETLKNSGYWYLHTDVDIRIKDQALAEIYAEIERLKTEPIPEEELEMVRNYTLGMLLTSIDGVFNSSGIIKDLVSVGLDTSFYQQFIERMKTVQAEDLQQIAQKYLQTSDLLEVVVE